MVTTRISTGSERRGGVRRDEARNEESKEKKSKEDEFEKEEPKKDEVKRADIKRSGARKDNVKRDGNSKDQRKSEDDFISPNGIGLLGEFPAEVIKLVVRNCDTGSLVNLNRASKFFHAYCHPVIYETVDLSVHNESSPFRSGLTDRQRRHWHAQWLVKDGDMLQKQRLFIRTVGERPTYAKLVKRLVWTFKTFVGREKSPQNRYIITAKDVWDAFTRLDNVTSLDFCCLRPDWPRPHPPSRSLFPKSTTIRLVGHLSLAMAEDLLHTGNLGRIEDLELDDTSKDEESLYTMYRARRGPATKASEAREKIYLFQPLVAHLLHVKSQCKSLSKLCIRSIGVLIQTQPWHVVFPASWYTVLSDFIDALRSTLKSLTIEQSHVVQIEGIGFDRRRVESIVVKMDANYSRLLLSRFQEYILPILQKGAWPQLEQIRLVGEPWSVDHLIGLDNGYGCDLTPILDTLEKGLGARMKISVERQASSTFGFIEPVSHIPNSAFDRFPTYAFESSEINLA